MAHKTHEAFYGARSRTERKANTVKSMTSPGERPQDIFTPLWMVDAIAEWWGGIALDPCSHPDSPVYGIASEAYYTPELGLQPWRDRTYWNPPYKDLKVWLAHALAQDGRWLGLIPVRPQRTWWLGFAERVDAICWLPPIKFEGYDQAFPAPLVLAYRGEDAPDLMYGSGPRGDALRVAGRWRGPIR